MSQADKVRRLLDEIDAERAHGRRNSRIVGLVILLLFVLFGTSLYSMVHSFDHDALLANLQEQATTRVWPLVSSELDATARQALPAITKAFRAEAVNLLPRLEEQLAAESKVFQDDIHKRLKESLDTAFKAAAQEHEAELRAKLPRFSTDSELYDDLMRRMRKSSQDWAMNQLDTVFVKHVQVLQSINESVHRLQAQADQKRGDEGDATVDDVLLLFADIVNTRLAGKEG